MSPVAPQVMMVHDIHVVEIHTSQTARELLSRVIEVRCIERQSDVISGAVTPASFQNVPTLGSNAGSAASRSAMTT